jgi:ribonucleoside-diphosphate reductase alpha chain
LTKYEDVKNQTTEEYFNGNQFSIDAFNKKYKLYPEETYVQALKRVCESIASVENTPELQKYWAEHWFDEIYNDWWHPAGSVMQGAGSDKKISLANCTTISMGVLDDDKEWDNLESIIKNTGYTLAKTAAYRQGLGIEGSRLRPRGSEILNSAVESTGVVHWLQWFDAMAKYVGQRGRIPAILLSLNIKHPDIEEFIAVKSDYTKIQNANISVQITNNFYKAVENNEDWELYFKIPAIKKGQPILLDVHSIDADCRMNDAGQWYKVATHNKKEQVIKKTVKAKKLLELIAQNMTNNAEPGIQNIDIAREYSNSDAVYDPRDLYDPRILSTNACSEQYLSRESLCILSSINMERFSVEPNEYKNELIVIGESINRFLDNVNTYELKHQTYATPHQRLAIEKLRRTGAGITNIGGWLFKQHQEYGTPSANLMIENFLDDYNFCLYDSTIKLGKEKGDFGLFNKEKILKAKFIKQLIKRWPGLTFDTMRNVTVSSIAPTGTLSLMFRSMVMSYGIEPAFGLYYWKRTRMSGKYEYYFVVPGVVRNAFKVMEIDLGMKADTIKDTWDGKLGIRVAKIIDEYKDKFKFKNATEINPLDKLDLMSRAMKSVDSSISVTYMLPENAEWKDTYKFILKAYETGVKSIAAFPDKKMYGIISYIPFKNLAFKLQKEKIAIHSSNFSDEELDELNLSKDYIHASSAPKRPIKLPADVYSITVKGEKFIVAIGLLNGAPYEIFCGKMNGLNFKFAYKEGIIEKVKKGQYRLVIGEDIEIEDFSGYFKPVESELFRVVSTSMRHGVPIKFLVEQLSKSAEDLSSLTGAASRVLKKYIKAGEIATGILCPQCGSEVIYNETGCTSCTSCAWEKCN